MAEVRAPMSASAPLIFATCVARTSAAAASRIAASLPRTGPRILTNSHAASHDAFSARCRSNAYASARERETDRMAFAIARSVVEQLSRG